MSGVTRWEPASDHRSGLGARYRMLIRVGAAEVGGLIEFVEWRARDRHGLDVGHRDRPARSLADPRRAPAAAPGSSFATPTASPGGGITGLLAERVAGRRLSRHLRRSLQQLKREVEHEQLRAEARRRREAASPA